MIIVTSAWTVAFFFANLFQCLPFSLNWTEFGLTVDQCTNTQRLGHAQIWSDVVTDGKLGSPVPMLSTFNRRTVMILSLPLPYVRFPSLRLPISTHDWFRSGICKCQQGTKLV